VALQVEDSIAGTDGQKLTLPLKLIRQSRHSAAPNVGYWTDCVAKVGFICRWGSSVSFCGSFRSAMPAALARWVYLVGAGSGRTLLQLQPNQNS
jgi:hypothetical protein